MKLKLILVTLLIFTLNQACTTTVIKSDWSTLKTSKKIECTNLLPSNSNLKILNLKNALFSKSKKKTNFAIDLQAMTRASREVSLYVDPNDNEYDLSSNKLRNVPVLSTDTYLASLEISSIPIRLYKVKLKSKFHLEFRHAGNNILYKKVPLLWQNIDKATIHVNSNTVWLVLSYDDDLDNNQSHIISFNARELINRKTTLKTTKFNKIKLKQKVQLVTNSMPDEASLFYLNNNKLFLQKIFTNGRVSKKVNLNIIKLPTIESWSISTYKNKLYISLLEGDSLLGNIILHLLEYTWNNDSFSMVHKDSLELNDTHLDSVKSVVSDTGKLNILISAWRDSESTIFHFKYFKNKIVNSNSKGVFPTGLILNDIVYNNEYKQIQTILRFRDRKKQFFKFKFCVIN